MKYILNFISIFTFCVSCSILHLNSKKENEKLGDLTVYSYQHYGFHYLKIVDKNKSFKIIYPVGEEAFQFNGAAGPIYMLTKHDFKSSKDFKIITSSRKDTVCFLNYCYQNNGTLTKIEKIERDIFYKIDSFCKKKYPFYKMDITQFQNWYSK